MSPESQDEEYRRALTASPDDKNLWAVYGDWLQTLGDPRGELINLQLAAEGSSPPQGTVKRVRQLLTDSRDALMGPFGDWVDSIEGGNTSRIAWRYGFVDDAVVVVETAEQAIDVISRLFNHACGQMLRRLELVFEGKTTRLNVEPLYRHLAELAPPTLAELLLVAPGRTLGVLDALWGIGSIRQLSIRGVDAAIDAACPLTRLSIEMPDDASSWLVFRSGSRLPALEALSVSRSPTYSVGEDDLRGPALLPETVPALRTLRLHDVKEALWRLFEHAEQVMPQLQVLDISGCEITARDVTFLQKLRGTHRLQRIVARGCALSPSVARGLRALTDRLDVSVVIGPTVAAARDVGESVTLVLTRRVDAELLARPALQLAQIAEAREVVLFFHTETLDGLPLTFVELASNDAQLSADAFAESVSRRGGALPRAERFKVLQLGNSDLRNRSAWRIIEGGEVTEHGESNASASIVQTALSALLQKPSGPFRAHGLARDRGTAVVIRAHGVDLPALSGLTADQRAMPTITTMAALTPSPATRAPSVSSPETMKYQCAMCDTEIEDDLTNRTPVAFCPACQRPLCVDCARVHDDSFCSACAVQ